MKPQSNSGAALKFGMPEIKIGLAAAKSGKAKSPTAPIASNAPDAARKSKRIPKRRHNV